MITILAEFSGALFAIHNSIRYIYLQQRYKDSGISLVIYYILAILVFTFRITQYIIEVNPAKQGEKSKTAYIVGTSVGIFELDIGMAMIMLIR